MVEYFTQQKNDTEIGEERTITVKKTDNYCENSLKQELDKLVKEPSNETIERILNFSKNLHQ